MQEIAESEWIESMSKGTRVWMRVAINGSDIGKIEIELFSDVPKTAYNFKCLCNGDKGFSYEYNRFHKIKKDQFIQAGDIINNDGTGGKSIYGPYFDDENFIHKHSYGTISMANCGPNTNASQFFIITSNKSMEHLDGHHVVFGKVTSKSMKKVVNQINSHTHLDKIRIVDSGLEQVKKHKLIDVIDAKKLLKDNPKAVLADIRDINTFTANHDPQAFHLTNENIPTFKAKVSFDRPVLLMCYHGISSQNAAKYLTQQGYRNVYSINGGYEAWYEED